MLNQERDKLRIATMLAAHCSFENIEHTVHSCVLTSQLVLFPVLWPVKSGMVKLTSGHYRTMWWINGFKLES